MEIVVGIGEMKITDSPHLIRAVGIGSCVAVALYDRDARIGGLAHIMLPCAEESRDTANPARFADTAIDMMLDGMMRRGAQIQNTRAKMFGGANMFPEIISSNSNMDVGKKNILAVRQKLKKQGIEIVAEEVGGHIGRTVLFDSKNGSVLVRTAQLSEREY